jgi:pseudaminic acid biosynthesis-associated methylase
LSTPKIPCRRVSSIRNSVHIFKKGSNFSDEPKTALFSRIFGRTAAVQSVVEFGCNIGVNLSVISRLLPQAKLCGLEITSAAAALARERLPSAEIVETSILDWNPPGLWDLTFTCGVMIHINPDMLPKLYSTLAKASQRYVLIAEYYNPSPVTIQYRGHNDRLFKRDFAGEFLAAHPEFELVDYGFVWRRDPVFPLDDITWFLLKRTSQT